MKRVLQSGLGTLPLAPLCKLPGDSIERGLASVIRQIEERLHRETSAEHAAKLLTAAFVLTGLRVTREVALELFKGVRPMRESTTYQHILAEGRAEGRVSEAREILLRQGGRRFGAPSPLIESELSAVDDLDRLERMFDRLSDVASWQELLATP